MRAVFRPALFLFIVSGVLAHAETAMTSATVTRVENQVHIGDVGNAQRQRSASVSDVVRAKDYVLTESASRAELQFDDKSIVRVGQNTVFSFDPNSRTLSLQKGAMLFYVPPGNGGTIKTPTLTAAITGTIAKVTANTIAVIAGSLQTPWGEVKAGQAIRWQDGETSIFDINPKEATSGILWSWGPLPELPEIHHPLDVRYETPDTHFYDVLDWTQVNPRVRSEIIKIKPGEDKKDDDGKDFVRRQRPSPRPSPTFFPSFFPIDGRR